MTSDLFNLAGVVNYEHQKTADQDKYGRKQHYTNRSPDVESAANQMRLNRDTIKRKQQLSKSL